MFESKDDARAFRDDVHRALDATDTGGLKVRPSLDGAHVFVGRPAAARGTLDGQGYRVREGAIESGEAGDWASKLVVIGR